MIKIILTIALRELCWDLRKVDMKKSKTKVMYDLLNKMGPTSLTNLFTYKSEVTNYNLRDILSGLCLPKPGTKNMKKSFMHDGPLNSIPKNIRGSSSLSFLQNKITTCTRISHSPAQIKLCKYRLPVNSLIML